MEHVSIETALEVVISTLACKSGGGGNTLETVAALRPEVYDALSVILHELGFCGEVGA